MEKELSFGEFIKQKRINAGLGSRELSRKIGLAETYVSQLERGKITNPDYQIIYSLCRAININPDKINTLLKQFNVTPDNNIYIKGTKGVNTLDEWFSNDLHELKELNKEIQQVLDLFIEKDLTRSKFVIKNLHSILTSSKEDFTTFCDVFEKDICYFKTFKFENQQ